MRLAVAPCAPDGPPSAPISRTARVRGTPQPSRPGDPGGTERADQTVQTDPAPPAATADAEDHQRQHLALQRRSGHYGAAKESNLPTAGLRRPAGFEGICSVPRLGGFAGSSRGWVVLSGDQLCRVRDMVRDTAASSAKSPARGCFGAVAAHSRLSHPGEAVAYIGDGSEWSVSRRLICLGDLPEGLRTAHSASPSAAERRRRTYATASGDCESGGRERQRSEAGSERPSVPMQDPATGPAGRALLLVRSERAPNDGADARLSAAVRVAGAR